MTVHDALDLAALRAAVKAPVLGPDDDGWDAARMAWNLNVDQRPAAVAFADDAADVAAIVDHARAAGLRIAVQATGHGASALPPLDDVVLLKTARMNATSVDPGARTARAEAGALWAPLAEAASEHGLAPLAGSSPDVGVVGYALGGGLGWLSRRYGLACNSIRAIELVTAAGEIVRADASENAELFWALRGGGGDFGVVTALELELFCVPRLYAGSVVWPLEHAPAVIHAYRDWSEAAPPELTAGIRFLRLPPIPEVPEPLRGVPVIDVTGAFAGDGAEGAAQLEPLRSLAPPLLDAWAEVPPAGLTRIYGDPEEPTPGMSNQTVLRELSAEAADALLELAGPGSQTPLLMVGTRPLGGALATSPESAGALGAIEGTQLLYGIGVPMTPDLASAIDADLDRMVEAVEPWATGGDCLNFADRPLDASGAFDDATLRRLREVKAAVDPEGLFLAAHPID